MSEKLTGILVKYQLIAFEEKEIYRFGIQQGIMLLLNFITVLAIGFAYDMLFYVLVYIIAYIPLRSYAGGFHAQTHMRCYSYSVIILNTVLLIIKFLFISTSIYHIITLISILIIFLLSPVEDINKPLDKVEYITYRKKVRMILFFETVIYFITSYTKHSNAISLAFFTISFFLIIGKIKLVVKCKEKNN
jgi:accessory gene regulator B